MTDFPQQPRLTIRGVPRRPVFHKESGEFFRGLRMAQGWGLRQAGRIASDKGLKMLTFNTLGTLERGATKNPEPELLREIAALYKVSFPDLVGRFLTQRYGIAISARDLPDHGAGVKREVPVLKSSAAGIQPPEGDSLYDTASARALHDVTIAYQTFFRAVQDVSSRLHRLVSEHEGTPQSDATPKRTSRRRSSR